MMLSLDFLSLKQAQWKADNCSKKQNLMLVERNEYYHVTNMLFK